MEPRCLLVKTSAEKEKTALLGDNRGTKQAGASDPGNQSDHLCPKWAGRKLGPEAAAVGGWWQARQLCPSEMVHKYKNDQTGLHVH